MCDLSKRVSSFFKFNTVTVILLIALLVLLIIGLLVTSNIFSLEESFLTVLVSLIGLILLVNFQILQRKKLYYEAVESFNRRYNDLNNTLNKIAKYENQPLEESELWIVHDYLNLCAEEHYWYIQWLIPKKVWNNWEKGIKYFLTKKNILTALRSEFQNQQNKDSYYYFFESNIFCNICKNNLKN